MLFETAAAEYMRDKSRRLRGNTLEGYASAINRHLMPAWEGRDLESISHEEVQAWVDSIPTYGAAGKAFKTFRQIYRWTIRKRQLRIWDVTQGIELPEAPVVRRPVLTASEERETLRGIMGQAWEAVVLCAAALGLRRCEACALEWGDVDYRTGEVHVSKGVHTVRGGEITTPTKTAKSDRVIVLPRFALMRLRKLAAGRRSGRMCPLRPDQVARRAASWCRRRGLPWVGMKNLRHSFATIAVASGSRIEDLLMVLGHSSYDTSFVHYLVRTSEICRRVSRAYGGAVLDS